MLSVWNMILQWDSTIKVSIELPVTTIHRRDWKIVESDVKPEYTHTWTNDKAYHVHVHIQIARGLRGVCLRLKRSCITSVSSYYSYIPVVPRIWAASWQNQQNDCAPSEDSDQPGHPLGLIRVFTVRQWVAKDPSFLHADSEDSDQPGHPLWSDLADAQADLSLRWVHMPFCLFCHEAAQFV